MACMQIHTATVKNAANEGRLRQLGAPSLRVPQLRLPMMALT